MVGILPPLKALAIDLLSMPAPTTATERTFSRYGFRHSSKHNRLNVMTAGKIMYTLNSYYLTRSDIENWIEKMVNIKLSLKILYGIPYQRHRA